MNFFDGTTPLGTATISGGQAMFTTSSLAVGTHSITAAYGGDSTHAASTSAVLTETVINAIPMLSPALLLLLAAALGIAGIAIRPH